jgi:hypothetical protein
MATTTVRALSPELHPQIVPASKALWPLGMSMNQTTGEHATLHSSRVYANLSQCTH